MQPRIVNVLFRFLLAGFQGFFIPHTLRAPAPRLEKHDKRHDKNLEISAKWGYVRYTAAIGTVPAAKE